MTHVLLKVYHVAAYHLSFLVFGMGGLSLSAVCFCLGWLPATGRTERFFQRLVHRHFVAWLKWLDWIGVQRVRYEGFEQLPPGGSCVLVANHFGLMDITYLLARLPEALCIFKPSVRRNPVLGASARRAGYLSSDGGHDMLRLAADKVAAGQTLIVFPEGTRSADGRLGTLKPGFVVIARRARAPIQLVRIACDRPLLPRGQPWWKIPPLPTHITLTLGPRLPAPAQQDTPAIVAAVEAWYRVDDGRIVTTAERPALAPAADWQAAS